MLRYFESREAILLDLLDAEVQDWIADLERSCPPGEGTPRQRGDHLAEALAGSMAARPVLCDLLSAQAAVLEHDISTEVAIAHKRAARQSVAALVELVARHLPELGAGGSAALVETTLLMATTAWPCSRPSKAVQAAYAADPALAGMRMDFTDLVRRTAAVTASGLLARRTCAVPCSSVDQGVERGFPGKGITLVPWSSSTRLIARRISGAVSTTGLDGH